MTRCGIRRIAGEDLPPLLRTIPDAPAQLYIRGSRIALWAQPAVAVVGTRTPTAWGHAQAVAWGRALARRDIMVVSGLARGCDTAAHRGCLAAGGRTVATLPGSLNRLYPPQNRRLAGQIATSGGCLLSEYPLGTVARPAQFIARDRLQSGLSVAVLVIETDRVGGTMHTARFCREQGRRLACLVPPPPLAEHPAFAGNRQLLADPATLAVRGIADLDKLLF
jgi:DNA processing protein